MSRIRRRHFLQLAGSSLAAIGLSQVDFLRQSNQMHRALAQATPRKLALLVGINGYEQSPLRGCVNDVRLQYELLVHRYGFNPQDIVIVTDSASASGLTWTDSEVLAGATREQIIQAFQEHLGMAQPGDVALFHYSGHGSYVTDPHPIDHSSSPDHQDSRGYQDFEGFNGTLVTTDRQTADPNQVNDIMGSTLFLLSRAIKTDNFTVVLDSCHAGGGVRGNITYRSIDRETGGRRRPSDAEIALQEALIADLGLTREQVQQARQAGIARGVAMGSARAYQLAAEQSYDGFVAGVFTYLLTRNLWQQGGPRPLPELFVDLARITEAEEGGDQEPVFFSQPELVIDQQPTYFLPPASPPAEAVMRGMRGEGVEMWLGGVTPKALEASGSIYEVLGEENAVVARIRQTGSRPGDNLLAVGRFIDDQGNAIAPPVDVASGTLLREEIRGIPDNLTLRIGLHESLGDELETAYSRLEGYQGLQPVRLTGNTPSDVLFGRFDTEAQTETQRLGIGSRSDVVAVEPNSVGIFKNDLAPLTDTFGSEFETAGEAISRLFPRFKLLLAKRALETLENETTAQLSVELEVGTTDRRGLAVISTGTARSAPVIPQLQAGENLTLAVTNRQSEPIYVAVLATEDNGNMYVYHPSNFDAAELEALLQPGETVTIPNGFRLPVQGPDGYFNVLVIASRFQLRDSLRALRRIAQRSRGDRFVVFDDTREASRSAEDSAFNLFSTILGDTSRASAVPTGEGALSRDSVLVFSTTLGVVE
jgi:hypothetical protein